MYLLLFFKQTKNYQKFGRRREITCVRWFANNKGADQPAHPGSLISAFLYRLSKSIISKFATNEISVFLASLCSPGDWFEIGIVGNLEDRFRRDEAQLTYFLQI